MNVERSDVGLISLQNAIHTTQEEEEGGGVSGSHLRVTPVSEVHGLNISFFFGTEDTDRKTLCGEHGDKTRKKSTGRVNYSELFVLQFCARLLVSIELRNICNRLFLW